MIDLKTIIESWNDRADGRNQWDALDDDEKFDLISEKYKARIKELEEENSTLQNQLKLCTIESLSFDELEFRIKEFVDGIRRLKATINADWSLSNSRLMSHVDACEHLFKLIEDWRE